MHDTQCFSLLYTSTEKVQGKDVEVNGFEKGCLPANENCETYCQLYMKYGYKDCKVDILGPYNPLSQCLVGLTIFNGVVFGHKFFTEVSKEDHSTEARGDWIQTLQTFQTLQKFIFLKTFIILINY